MKKFIITEQMLKRIKSQMLPLSLAEELDELKPVEPLSFLAKKDLVTNWFADGWAVTAALGLLGDFETAIESHITGSGS